MSWPILTGERGHYELAAGRDPMPFIHSMEKFANAGGMIAEQLWDLDSVPGVKFKPGDPTGAAMPLCWSHAEYVSLVRSRRDGVCFDRIEPVFERYAVNHAESAYEIWTVRHPIRKAEQGKTVRVILPADAAIIWTADAWVTTNTTNLIQNESLNLWFADLPTKELPAGSTIELTLLWRCDQRWEGKDWSIRIG